MATEIRSVKECVAAKLASKDDVTGTVNSMDLKIALSNIYPDDPNFHVDLLASGLLPIDPEPGSRGASITSCRCSRRLGRPGHRTAARSSPRQSSQQTT